MRDFEPKKMKAITFTGIRRVLEKANKMAAEGRNVVHFEIGQPDFVTPKYIRDAACEALQAGNTRYTSNYGIDPLRAAIAEKLRLENKMIHPKFEDKIRNVLSDPFIFPNDIIERLKEDKTIWENYLHFSDAYKRIRIAYIEAARKRPEEFEKRLNNFINKTKENKKITGFGGIEKYY